MCVQLNLLLLKYTPWVSPSVRTGQAREGTHGSSFDGYTQELLLSVCITYQLRCFADGLGLPIVNYRCQSLHKNMEQRQKIVNDLNFLNEICRN